MKKLNRSNVFIKVEMKIREWQQISDIYCYCGCGLGAATQRKYFWRKFKIGPLMWTSSLLTAKNQTLSNNGRRTMD